ncbi:MAG TPA: alpha/beta fold hydrolase [Thermoleophilaceae bacterium]
MTSGASRAGLALTAAAGALLANRRALGRQAKPAAAGAGRLVGTAAGELHVLEEGAPDAPPAVLVHGFAGSMHWFDRLAPLLRADHRVVRVDALGHGGSAKPLTDYSIEQQGAAVAEALGAIGVERALFVGHSFGAAVSVAVAEHAPGLVERLVLLDEGPTPEFGHEPFMTRLGFAPVIGELLHRLAFGSAIRDGYRDAFAGGFDMATGFDDPDQVVHDFRAMTFPSYSRSWAAEQAFLAASGLDERLRRLGIPVHAVFGREDAFFRADDCAAAYRRLPNARVEVLEEAGHSPNVERAAEVARVVRDLAAVAA